MPASSKPDACDERLRELINHLPVVIWEIDANGIITLSEGKALAGLGFKPGELVGVSVFELFKDRPDLVEDNRRALAGESLTTFTEVNGTVMEGRVTPKRDATGRVVGLAGMAVDVTERVRMERAVRGLSRRLWAVLEEERRRIARELHDEAGQTTTALKLLLDRAAQEEDRDASRRMIAEAGALCGSVLEELRRISFDLRPGALEELGLKPSLAALVDRFERVSGVITRLESPGELPALDGDSQAAIYRFVQEALTNVTRHAHAAHVDVRVDSQPKRLFVEAVDDGVGFVPAEALGGAGLGLIGMRERSRMLGGRLVIDSAPGRGTRVRLELPLASAA